MRLLGLNWAKAIIKCGFLKVTSPDRTVCMSSLNFSSIAIRIFVKQYNVDVDVSVSDI